jgi:hypothetical protein
MKKNRVVRRPTEWEALDNFDPFDALRAEKRARAEKRERAEAERAEKRAKRVRRAKRARSEKRNSRERLERVRAIASAPEMVRDAEAFARACVAHASEARKALERADRARARAELKAARDLALKAQDALARAQAIEAAYEVGLVPDRTRRAVALASALTLALFKQYNAPARERRRARAQERLAQIADAQAARKAEEAREAERVAAQKARALAPVKWERRERFEVAGVFARTRDGCIWYAPSGCLTEATFRPRGRVIWAGVPLHGVLVDERKGIVFARPAQVKSEALGRKIWRWEFIQTHARGGTATSGVGVWVAGARRARLKNTRGDWKPAVSLITPAGVVKTIELGAPIKVAEPDGSGGIYVTTTTGTYHVALSPASKCDGRATVVAYPLS